jgi:hypothetical protein
MRQLGATNFPVTFFLYDLGNHSALTEKSLKRKNLIIQKLKCNCMRGKSYRKVCLRGIEVRLMVHA